jgi:hypothetical protein
MKDIKEDIEFIKQAVVDKNLYGAIRHLHLSGYASSTIWDLLVQAGFEKYLDTHKYFSEYFWDPEVTQYDIEGDQSISENLLEELSALR